MKLTRLRILALVFGGLAIASLATGKDPEGFVVGTCIVLFLDYLND